MESEGRGGICIVPSSRVDVLSLAVLEKKTSVSASLALGVGDDHGHLLRYCKFNGNDVYYGIYSRWF